MYDPCFFIFLEKMFATVSRTNGNIITIPPNEEYEFPFEVFLLVANKTYRTSQKYLCDILMLLNFELDFFCRTSIIEMADWKSIIELVSNAKQVVYSVQDVARKLADYAKFSTNKEYLGEAFFNIVLLYF